MQFEDLIKRISPKLKGITYRLNGHFSYFNEQDLYQEAMVFLWQEFCSGELQDKTESYILQGCYFHLKNYIRKTKIRNNVVSIDAFTKEDGQPYEAGFFLRDEASEGYFDSLNDKLLAQTIQNNGLNGREKKILIFICEGLTTRQIGSKLGVSHVRVVKLMAEIRRKCARYIAEVK